MGDCLATSVGNRAILLEIIYCNKLVVASHATFLNFSGDMAPLNSVLVADEQYGV